MDAMLDLNGIIRILSTARVVVLPPTLMPLIHEMQFQPMPELLWPMALVRLS